MIETNIRIVVPGQELEIETRCAQIITPTRSPEIRERGCNALRRRGLAAVCCPGKSELLVLTREPIAPRSLQEKEWHAEVKDGGRRRQLRFANPEDRLLLAQLLERCLLIEIERHTKMRTLDSPRLWYEPAPFQWTKKPIRPEVLPPYNSLDDVFSRLKQERQLGVIVLVFEDEDPETYYRVSYELKGWRVKRITYSKLEDYFTELQSAESHNGFIDGKLPHWHSFTEMSALDVLQQMDCVPWGLSGNLHYDAHLAIDVGKDRRYFALSLLIFRPSLRLYTIVERKPDPKRETINGTILRDKIVALFQKAAQRHQFEPLRSVLTLRDGREYGDELESIEAAKEQRRKMGILDPSLRMDVVDFHKSIAKEIRLWNRTRENQVQQVLEGDALILDKRTVVLANTGAATLHQGTADPIMLEARGDDIDMIAVAEAVHASTHLNFSNPHVAQRLPLEFKRTDDELESRAAQEVRHLR